MNWEDAARKQSEATILLISYEYWEGKTLRHRLLRGGTFLCAGIWWLSATMGVDAYAVRAVGITTILMSLGWFWSALLGQKRAAEKLEEKHPELV